MVRSPFRALMVAMSAAILVGCGHSPPPVGKAGPAMPDETTIKALVAKLEGYSERETDVPMATPADKAAFELSQIGKPAVPYLLEALKSPKPWARVHSMEILASLREPKAVQPMLEILKKDPEPGVPAIAAGNLGSFHDPAALPDLRSAARSDDANLARSAWRSLGEMKDEPSIPLLIEHLGIKATFPQTGPITDSTPADALVKIGSPAVQPLADVLKRKGGEAQLSAAIALGQIGSKAAFEILRTTSKPSSTRDAAYAGLFACTRDEVKPLVIAALDDHELVLAAEDYLAEHPDPAAAKPMIRILGGRYPESARIGAATALGRIRDPSVVDALKRYRHDPSHFVRVAIVESLTRLGESSEW
ncbi:MAG: HEAT repeat domain-containing protein [Fimbriimonadales bacterium]